MISKVPQSADKTVFVTGGALGIGLAVTELFLLEGARVFALDYSVDNIKTAKARFDSLGFKDESFELHHADAADEEGMNTALNRCVERFGGLDVAILNAGVGCYGSIDETTLETYDRVMRINARSSFIGIKYAAQKIRAGGRGGSILLTASLASKDAFQMLGPYSMSKYATHAIAVTAAAEYAKDKIRVNCVSPGYVSTTLTAWFPDLEERIKASPAGRPAETAEVAKLFFFLASDDAAMISGSNYSIDGGMRTH